MGRRIVMDFERGGRVEADLLETEAPETCEAVLSALPIEHEVIHAKWAGDEIFFDGFPLASPLELENETNDVKPGAVACIATPCVRRLAKEGVTSFCVFYGPSRPRKGVDQTVDVNVFARVEDIPEIAAIGSRIRFRGAEKVRISAAEPQKQEG